MAEPGAEQAPGQAPESVPNDLIIAELEAALHRLTSENVILRARIAARDRAAAQVAAPVPALPAPGDAAPDLAGPEVRP